MHHTDVMHVADGRHQSAHDATGLGLAEELLPSDPLQQLTASQELQDKICVQLNKQKITTLESSSHLVL